MEIENNKKEETQEPFTIGSGGGPKDGPCAGMGVLADNQILPKKVREKTGEE